MIPVAVPVALPVAVQDGLPVILPTLTPSAEPSSAPVKTIQVDSASGRLQLSTSLAAVWTISIFLLLANGVGGN